MDLVFMLMDKHIESCVSVTLEKPHIIKIHFWDVDSTNNHSIYCPHTGRPLEMMTNPTMCDTHLKRKTIVDDGNAHQIS